MVPSVYMCACHCSSQLPVPQKCWLKQAAREREALLCVLRTWEDLFNFAGVLSSFLALPIMSLSTWSIESLPLGLPSLKGKNSGCYARQDVTKMCETVDFKKKTSPDIVAICDNIQLQHCGVMFSLCGKLFMNPTKSWHQTVSGVAFLTMKVNTGPLPLSIFINVLLMQWDHSARQCSHYCLGGSGLEGISDLPISTVVTEPERGLAHLSLHIQEFLLGAISALFRKCLTSSLWQTLRADSKNLMEKVGKYKNKTS